MFLFLILSAGHLNIPMFRMPHRRVGHRRMVLAVVTGRPKLDHDAHRVIVIVVGILPQRPWHEALARLLDAVTTERRLAARQLVARDDDVVGRAEPADD